MEVLQWWDQMLRQSTTWLQGPRTRPRILDRRHRGGHGDAVEEEERAAEEVRAGRVGDDGAVAEADIFVGAVAGDRLLLGASQARPGAGGRVGRQAQL